jgi:serine/threonine protein kinase
MSLLKILYKSRIPVPRIYDTFYMAENIYLVMEEISGKNMQMILHHQKNLPLIKVLKWAKKIADHISLIHESGYVWRDCKPYNFIVFRNEIRPIDFEGSYHKNNLDRIPWGTKGYIPPEWPRTKGVDEDL